MNPFEEVPYKAPGKVPLRKRTVKLIWFRMGPDRDYPLYLRKAYKKFVSFNLLLNNRFYIP